MRITGYEMQNLPEKHIDLTYLHRHTKSDPALMIELINIYLEQTPILVKAMKEGLENKDWRLLNAAAHKIAPSFYVMGMYEENGSAIKKIQELASLEKDGQLIVKLVKAIETICNEAREELQTEMISLKNL
jgi:HPt (histidine-containing phosphotransfer) domain-containing protein